MRDDTITCDGCGRDITYTGNSVDYRLILASESKPRRGDGSVITDMMIYPDLDRPCHFCGLLCLDKWRNEKRKDAR